jgi:glutamate carboxypeptidase
MSMVPDPGPRLAKYMETRLDAMLEVVEHLVRLESPSRDKSALDVLCSSIASRFERLGLQVERLENPSGGDHLLMTSPGESPYAPGLVLALYDTGWPVGTLEKMPFRIEDGRAFGPGIFDMKASLMLAEFALEANTTLGLTSTRPIQLLVTSDEEIGSPTSRAIIEEQGRKSAYVLVLEPPLPRGKLKTARKGVGRFRITVQGRAAHAGVEPEKGINAVVELAHQVLALGALADPALGTTVNVGVIQGGTTPNVVPAEATAAIDVRASTLAEAERISRAILGLLPVLAGARLELSGGFNRPPMERTPQVAALYERARVLGKSLGLDLGEGSTGGGSDGNFTAALGLPTLDGLGASGAGAHADHEHIVIEPLPRHAALLALLLLKL